jgi:transcriptional regulator with XRE-family HTH domain
LTGLPLLSWYKRGIAERLNARQLALRIGVSPSYITRMLTDERNPPTDDLILKIADVLDLDPSLDTRRGTMTRRWFYATCRIF